MLTIHLPLYSRNPTVATTAVLSLLLGICKLASLLSARWSSAAVPKNDMCADCCSSRRCSLYRDPSRLRWPPVPWPPPPAKPALHDRFRLLAHCLQRRRRAPLALARMRRPPAASGGWRPFRLPAWCCRLSPPRASAPSLVVTRINFEADEELSNRRDGQMGGNRGFVEPSRGHPEAAMLCACAGVGGREGMVAAAERMERFAGS